MKVYLLPWGIYVHLVEGGTCHGARRKGTTHLKSITAEKKKHFKKRLHESTMRRMEVCAMLYKTPIIITNEKTAIHWSRRDVIGKQKHFSIPSSTLVC